MAAVIGVSVKPASKDYTCDVPLDALEQDGVPPEEGDSVEYSVKGTVQSVDGDTATVKIESVNGEPVGESGSPEEEAGEGEGPPSTPPTSGASAGGPRGLGGKRGANLAKLAAMRSRLGGPGAMPFM